MQETKVIQLDGESKVALVFGQMNEPPGARARVALTGVGFTFAAPPLPKESGPSASPFSYSSTTIHLQQSVSN